MRGSSCSSYLFMAIPKHMDRLVPSAFVGNAGEFFVLAELTRRGWTAALTARNNRAYDILAKRGNEFAAIRVKAKTSGFTVFQWNAKPDGEIFLEITEHNDFCVLVDVPEDTTLSPSYYVVPTHVIDKWLKDDFHAWVTTPGARGQQRAKDNKRRLFYVDDDSARLSHGYKQKLATYKGAWEALAKREHVIEQLATLAEEAGLDLVELLYSGMDKYQMVDYIVDNYKQMKTSAKSGH